MTEKHWAKLLKLRRKQCKHPDEDVSHLKSGLNTSFCVFQVLFLNPLCFDICLRNNKLQYADIIREKVPFHFTVLVLKPTQTIQSDGSLGLVKKIAYIPSACISPLSFKTTQKSCMHLSRVIQSLGLCFDSGQCLKARVSLHEDQVSTRTGNGERTQLVKLETRMISLPLPSQRSGDHAIPRLRGRNPRCS